MEGNEREENPPRITTLRRSVLASAGKNVGHPRNQTTGAKTCFLHGLGHSTEECKTPKDYPAKYTAQIPHNEIEALSGGNKKRVKTVNFDGKKEEVNSMTSHDATTPRKTRKKNQAQNPNNDKDTAVPKEKELVYGIDRLDIGGPTVKLERDSK